jgi:hypothetical protein
LDKILHSLKFLHFLKMWITATMSSEFEPWIVLNSEICFWNLTILRRNIMWNNVVYKLNAT